MSRQGTCVSQPNTKGTGSPPSRRCSASLSSTPAELLCSAAGTATYDVAHCADDPPSRAWPLEAAVPGWAARVMWRTEVIHTRHRLQQP